MKVLIVEDMSSMRVIIKGELAQMGVLETNCTEARDGEAGWETLNANPDAFNLVLLDINMPKLNGLDLLKRLRADSRFTELPIVMLSSEAESDVVSTALKCGANQYVTKPISSEKLKKALAPFIEG